jgi:peptidyl-prolyl cis-trans isomerase C
MRTLGILAVLAVGLFLFSVSGCKDCGGEKPAAVADSVQPAPGPTNAPAANARITGPVAKVNGTEIPSTEFYTELDKITQGGARNIPDDRLKKIRENILNRLIEEELLKQEVKKQAVEVTEQELTVEFDKYKARFKTEDQFQNYLTHGKTTVEDIKARLRQSAALTKLLTKLGKLDVTDDEVKKAYETGIKMYTEPEQVHAQHVLIKVAESAAADQVAAANKKATEALKRIQKGEDFALVAKDVSDDAMSKEKGGDLGFFRRGVMVPKFEDAAFQLKPGELSKDPVRSPFGFHVVKVLERKEERVKPFDEVKDQIADSLRNRNTFKARRELVDKLKVEAKIEKFITD